MSNQTPYIIKASEFDPSTQERQIATCDEDLFIDDEWPGRFTASKPIVVRDKPRFFAKKHKVYDRCCFADGSTYVASFYSDGGIDGNEAAAQEYADFKNSQC